MKLQVRWKHFRTFGFSLIELMVVLVLIAILTAMIIPEMKGTYEDALLRSAARRLVGVVTLAHSRAMTVHELHRVRINRTDGRYFVERAVHGGRGGFVSIWDVPGGEGRIDPRISIEIRKAGEDPSEASDQNVPAVSANEPQSRNPDEAIAFYPDGTADAEEI